MAWGDIPRWQNMSKDDLLAELKSEHEQDSLLDQARWIYVNNCYELSASISQEIPKRYYRILWPKSRAVWF